MLNTSNFFYDSSFNLKKYKKNFSKTKKIFESFKEDLENFEIPLLQSYKKDYIYDFSKNTIKKFSKYKNIVIIGMGGSALGAKTIHSFFKKKIKKKVFFFDNLDINLHLEFKKISNIKNSCFIVVSKSGNTLETIFNLSIIFSKPLLKNKIIIISEIKNNNLMDIANNLKADIIEHKDFISGRYSVFSEAGMFPAALMGLNINKFKNLKKFIGNKKFVSCLLKNVASIYTLNTKGVRNSVILNYNSIYNDLGHWYQQLVAESLGKSGKGITPILSEAPKDHHSLFQLYLDGPKDKFFTFFSSSKIIKKYKASRSLIPKNMKYLKNKNLEFVIKTQCNATKSVFKSKKIPYRHFSFNKNDESELGMIFTFFVLETILLARLLKVNPFSQPAVEQIKAETKKILLK